MSSSFEPIEPEDPIEQSNFALYLLSKQGELKPLEEPRVVIDLQGASTVFLEFEAVPGEEFRLFVRHDSPVDASADILFDGRSLGKWFIARSFKVWHNIACDSHFKFDTYDHRSKVEPSTFEIRFQYLSRVSEGRDQNVLVPTAMREPSPEDGPGWVKPSDELMQSRFEAVEDDPFLTFVVAMHPPPATYSPPTTSSPLMTCSLPTTPSSLRSTSSLPTMSSLSMADTLSTTSTSSTMSTLSTTPTTLTTSSPLMTSSMPITPSSPLTTSSLPTTSTLSTTDTLSTTSTLFTTNIPSTRTTSSPFTISSQPTDSSSLLTTSTLYTTPTTPTPGSPLLTPPHSIAPSPPVLKQPLTNPEPAPESTLPSGSGPAASPPSPASISRMSDSELQEALSEYEKSSLLLPPRLIPGFRGKLPIEDFCFRYELPEDVLPLLAQMGIKDAHGLSSKRLRDLRDKGMVPRSIMMLRLAVIRFSSESGPCVAQLGRDSSVL